MKRILLVCALLFVFPLSAKAETESSNVIENSSTVTEQSTVTTTSENQTANELEESSTTATSEDMAGTTTSSSELENIEVKDVKKAEEKTVDKIEKETGVKKTDDPVDDNMDADQIRETMKQSDLGSIISEKEINSYTDQQLLNAMTLTMRMSSDTYGLDIGGYARILQALYKDNSLSWENIQTILNFDPNKYTNAIEMIDDIDSLQAYLNALYPSTSSFFGVRNMSREELINVLKYISPIQEEMIGTGNSFFPGIIAWISRYADDENIRRGVTPVASTIDTNSDTASSEQAVSSTNSAENKADDKEDKILGILPKTGEQRNFYLTIFGVIVLVIIAVVMVMRNRRKN